MNLMNRVITGGYWVAYYLVYVVGVVYLMCLFRHELPFLSAGLGQLDLRQLFIVAAILAVAGGTALFIAINVEVTGRMVLLIPKAWNRAKSEGRAEERDRVRTILSQYAQRDPATGRLVVELDAVASLLNGKDNGNGKD